MMANPLVSVIIPVYQRAHTISKAILSVADQDYQNLEIIVVDDHSSDTTPELVNDLQKKDSRIKFIQLASNVGPAGARNTGVSNAKGEYIAFLDSDDEWLQGKLNDQVKILEKYAEAGVVFTDCKLVEKLTGSSRKLSAVNAQFKKDLELRPISGLKNFFSVHGPIQQSLYKKFFIVISSVLIRKTSFELINGFDPRRFGTEDIDFFVRLAPHCEFIYWDCEKVAKNTDETGLSATNERWLLEQIAYHKICLNSNDYSDLFPVVKWNLERFFKYLIIFYAKQWKPINAIGVFIQSRKYFFSFNLLFFTILSFLGGFPYILYSFIQNLNKNINQIDYDEN